MSALGSKDSPAVCCREGISKLSLFFPSVPLRADAGEYVYSVWLPSRMSFRRPWNDAFSPSSAVFAISRAGFPPLSQESRNRPRRSPLDQLRPKVDFPSSPVCSSMEVLVEGLTEVIFSVRSTLAPVEGTMSSFWGAVQEVRSRRVAIERTDILRRVIQLLSFYEMQR